MTVALTDSQRRTIVGNLIKSWNIQPNDAAVLLRLDGDDLVSNYESFCGPNKYPLSDEQRLRIDLLITIHRILDGLYPENPRIVDAWMNHRNPLLDDRTALEIACNDENGLNNLLAFLMHQCAV